MLAMKVGHGQWSGALGRLVSISATRASAPRAPPTKMAASSRRSTRLIRCHQRSPLQRGVPKATLREDATGLGRVAPTVHLDVLSLGLFVDGKEVGDLVAELARKVVEGSHVAPQRI